MREKSFCSRKNLKALLIRVSQFISGVKLCEEDEADEEEKKENPEGFQRKEGEHLHTVCLSLANGGAEDQQELGRVSAACA